MKKEVDNEADGGANGGCWDAIHQVQCSLKQATKTEPQRVDYRIISAALLSMKIKNEDIG